MAEISVESSETADGWRFDVRVADGGSESRHEVTLSRSDRDRIARGAAPDELVRESFTFLLEREPKESILRSFDLTVIARYFPEYERAMAERFGS
ncbi:MAG: hypothetical protein IIA90_03840 [Chloroflexi bacterium]|nr:hypothetical protein [Chloroflexota bacterium]